jgi:hypothetical protein
LSIGDIVSGIISTVGDKDYYKFHETTGQKISAAVEARMSGSMLSADLRLFDSNGITQLTKRAYNTYGSDPFITYILPHDCDYYILVESYFTAEGSPNHFYSLLLNQAAVMGGNVIVVPTSCSGYNNIFVYRAAGCFLFSTMIGNSYSIDLPPGNYKVYCRGGDSYGALYNRKDGYANADVLPLPHGGQVSADFFLVRKAMFQPILNQMSFITGDRLQVDVQASNGSIPSKLLVAVDVLFPETGGDGFGTYRKSNVAIFIGN